jgi:purine nucleosidase
MGFLSRFKREVWKVIRGILIIGVLISLIISVITYSRKISGPETVSVIIDCDSGTGIDGLFAVSYALTHPKIEVTGLTSAQWNFHPEGGDSSVYASQQANEMLLQLHDRQDIPHPPGAARPTGYRGVAKAVPSPAAAFILEETAKIDYGKKLNVITLGAVTNLASAILMDSAIIPKIRWYAMGLKYDDRTKVWNKNEFNARNDLDGMDYLLNRTGLETHIMTASASAPYLFERTETFDLLAYRAPRFNYLVEQWKERMPESRSTNMHDLALIQAIMHPDLVTEKEIWTPAENHRHRIYVYTWIDEEKMKREYRKLIRKALGDISSDIE